MQIRAAVPLVAVIVLFASIAAAQDAVPAPAAAETPTRVPEKATIFIEPTENGMHTSLAAAIHKKKVPVTLVTAADKADFVIAVVGEYKKAGWARQLMTGARGDSNASMTVTHRHSGTVVYAYNVDKSNAARGIQSAAEACAKHLGNHIKGKE